MKKILTLILIISSCLFSQNKLLFDVNRTSEGNYKNSLSKMSSSSDELKNSYLSATILNGGYYTIGTTSGVSNSSLDDNCQITFGHPYAKTSFPIFSLDGTWYKFDDYFSPSELLLSWSGDTLQITGNKINKLSVKFSMYSDTTELRHEVILKQSIKNLDSTSHSIALGFTFDPALGKWGDGFLELQQGFLNKNKIFNSPSVPDKITLWEKAFGAKGIGAELSFENNSPTKIVAANWKDIFESNEFSSLDTLKLIYDLYLKLYWQESQLISQSEKQAAK